MKTNIKRIALFIAIAMVVNYSALGQEEEHIITLYVNTADIKKPNMNKYCDFGEAQINQNTSVEDYTVFVKNGDSIKWVGVSKSSEDDRVEITAINYHGGKNVLGKNVIKGVDGVVVGKVVNSEKGDEEKYIIFFRVYNNGVKRNGKFQIDPKLKIKDRQ